MAVTMKNAVFWDVAAVGLVRTDITEEHAAFIFRVERISKLETLAVTRRPYYCQHPKLVASLHAKDGGNLLLRNLCSNKTHKVPHPARRNPL
jgi:hypothetical protein